jgi:methylamine---glutamate N-methyltransferase subunit B
MAEINCEGKTTREINTELKQQIAQGETQFWLKKPGAAHNLGVAILQPVQLFFEGSVGYYCAGMIDGPMVDIRGSAGWGVAESMLNGSVIVRGSAGNGAGAAIRGGALVIHGDAAARAGVSMKGGLILIGGNCGYMSGFMGQKGKLIVCGDAGPAFADSMYETVCYVGGQVQDLGNDAIIAEMTDEDVAFLETTLARYFPDKAQAAGNFKKIVAGRKLWNFKKQERTVWREAL